MKYNPQIHHRRSIRLKGYDYSQAGAYFITICTKNRKCLFGQVVNGEMILNEMGQIAYNEWLKTPELRPNVSLDVFVIMPNHVHGIIVIIDMGEFDSPIPPPSADMPPTPFRSPSNNIGAIVRRYKSSVTKQINLLNYSGSAWHRNYHEHIIRNEESYHRISDYIINNPKKWNDDKFYMK
jgi:putative transposase